LGFTGDGSVCEGIRVGYHYSTNTDGPIITALLVAIGPLGDKIKYAGMYILGDRF